MSQEKVEITLTKKHVHQGREFGRGDTLALRADQAGWLLAKHVAVRKGEPLPALPTEIKTVQDMREVEAAVAADLRAKATAKAVKA